LAKYFCGKRYLLAETALHLMENGGKHIGQAQDADNLFVPCYQKGLVVPHDQLMDRFAQRRIFGYVFAFAGRVHKLFDVFLSCFAADIRQGFSKEMILLQHGLHELFGQAEPLNSPALD